jgi:hypothetical protein
LDLGGDPFVKLPPLRRELRLLGCQSLKFTKAWHSGQHSLPSLFGLQVGEWLDRGEPSLVSFSRSANGLACYGSVKESLSAIFDSQVEVVPPSPRVDLGDLKSTFVSARDAKQLLDRIAVTPLIVPSQTLCGFEKHPGALVHRWAAFGRELITSGLQRYPLDHPTEEQPPQELLESRLWMTAVGCAHLVDVGTGVRP